MELKHIDIAHLSVSLANMRAKGKSPDLGNILPSVRARGVPMPLIVRQNGSPDSYEIVAANRDATGKVKRQIIRDCLTGANGRAKIEGWVPRWMAFPPTAYMERGGVPTFERSVLLADLVESLTPQASPLAQAA